MKSALKPRDQARFRGTQVDAGDSDAGESELIGPAPDVRHETRTVHLNTSSHHPPIVKSPPLTLAWPDEEATRAYAAGLAAHPAIGDAFVELHGDLGAGKTTFVRHLLRALGVAGRVKSPTYTVMEPHEGAVRDANGERRVAIYHFDFYRFNDPREWEDAGFRDVFAGPGLKLAEWPEKAAGLLPVADLALHIEAQADGSRRVRLEARTPVGEALLAA